MSPSTRESSTSPRLTGIATAAYRDVARLKAGDNGVPPIDARYYKYAGLRSTVRLREGRILVRLSDLFVSASDEAVGALVRILFAKLLRRRVRAEWTETYRRFTSQSEVVEASEATRRVRGTKRLAPAAGRVYDLDAMFDRLNFKYFAGMLRKPALGWTLRDAWRTHGHYDPAHDAIAMSRSLDVAEMPEFVVELVLYHEMLHVAMPAEMRDGRHRHHTAEFRRMERRFPRIEEAEAYLESWVKKNGTGRRRRRLTRRG
ncbi:MAG TPA: M48 family peptidase [Blastocatellia bacterium]|nr:M48 family peptidase [Blastocatellia bacterium]